jgi:hypothetical protein
VWFTLYMGITRKVHGRKVRVSEGAHWAPCEGVRSQVEIGFEQTMAFLLARANVTLARTE